MEFKKELTFIETIDFVDKNGIDRKKIVFQDEDDKLYNFLYFDNIDLTLLKPYSLYCCLLSISLDKNYNYHLNFKGIVE